MRYRGNISFVNNYKGNGIRSYITFPYGYYHNNCDPTLNDLSYLKENRYINIYANVIINN